MDNRIIYPDRYIHAIFVGILWEIFEAGIVHIKPLYELTKKYWIIPERYWNETNKNKFFDLIVNMIGYFIGGKIRHDIIKC
jgi:hypothetical protein